MMRYNFAVGIAGILLPVVTFGSNPQGRIDDYVNVPSMVAWERELPRGEVIPCHSAVDADNASRGKSQYLQPLADWKSSEKDGGLLKSCQFKMPFAWVDREIFLHMDQTDMPYYVAVNGRKIGYTQNGTSVQEFDLTRHVKEGNNTLEIILSPSSPARKISPACNVTAFDPERSYICAQPKVRVRDIVVNTAFAGDGTGLFSLGIVMKSHLLNPKTYEVFYELISPSGETVAQEHRTLDVDMRREDTVRFFANIPGVLRWSHETANLYTVRVKTRHEGRFPEYLSFKTGFRSVDMAGGKLRINGYELPVAACRYSPAPGADETATIQELRNLKSRGFNTVILQSPQPDGFYSLCDMEGMYVCTQAAIGGQGNPSNDPGWRNSYIDRVMGMYHNVKSHPCAIIFSMAADSPNGFNLCESYMALKHVEPSRPVIFLGAGAQWNSDAMRPDLYSSHEGKSGRVVELAPAVKRISFGETAMPAIPAANGLTFNPVNLSDGRYMVTNNFTVTPIVGKRVNYTVYSGKKRLFAGYTIIDVEPSASKEITLSMGNAKGKAGVEVKFDME